MREVHPGEILKYDYGIFGTSEIKSLAEKIDYDVFMLERFIEGFGSVDDDLADKLAENFNTTKGFWLNLQSNYDEAKRRRFNAEQEYNKRFLGVWSDWLVSPGKRPVGSEVCVQVVLRGEGYPGALSVKEPGPASSFPWERETAGPYSGCQVISYRYYVEIPDEELIQEALERFNI